MIRRQVIGAGLILGILTGIGINAYNISHPETFESHFVYVAEAEEPQVVQIAVKIDWTPERIEKEIDEQAQKYGRDPEYLKAIVKCESNGSTTIQSHYRKNGIREDSWGLVQIHLPSHPGVTKEQALAPEFAIEFLAKNIGTVYWSCEKYI